MADWIVSLQSAAPSIIVAVIAATGGWATAIWQSRSKAKDDRQALIDQLQEERNHSDEQRRLEREAFSSQLAAERESFAAQLTSERAEIQRMYMDKAASRDFVAALKDHIWQRKDPPPPEPPAGYIH